MTLSTYSICLEARRGGICCCVLLHRELRLVQTAEIILSTDLYSFLIEVTFSHTGVLESNMKLKQIYCAELQHELLEKP